eukprot:10923240-Prorocentrum_lima.AAC.1
MPQAQQHSQSYVRPTVVRTCAAPAVLALFEAAATRVGLIEHVAELVVPAHARLVVPHRRRHEVVHAR